MRNLIFLIGLATAAGAVELQWDPATGCDVTNYLVFRAEAGSTNFVFFGQTSGTNFAVPSGCGDRYFVRAQNAVASSEPSSVVTNRVPSPPAALKIEVTIKLISQ